MTDEKTSPELDQADEVMLAAAAIEREHSAELAAARRDVVFLLGVAVGLMVALHLILRRDA